MLQGYLYIASISCCSSFYRRSLYCLQEKKTNFAVDR